MPSSEVSRWAAGKGLVAMLETVADAFPALLPPTGARTWEPTSRADKAVQRAYRQAPSAALRPSLPTEHTARQTPLLPARASSPRPPALPRLPPSDPPPPFQATLARRCCPHATLTILEGRGHNDLTSAAEYWPSVAALVEEALTRVVVAGCA